MNIYQNNAFRVLGLLTNATTQDIVSRAEEIKAKKSVDVHEVYDYEFPWLGPIDRSEENISSSVQRLEDPVRRVKQELSWFWIYSKEDQDAIAWLTRNRPKSAVDIWLKAAGISLNDLSDKDFSNNTAVVQGNLSPESLSALHNLFVLLQAVLLRNEILPGRSSEMIMLLDNTEQAEKDWAIALKIFNFLHENPKFWELVQKRMTHFNDRRLQNLSLEEIKESALNNALSAHFYLITRALEKRDIGLLDKHIEILEKADMPAELYQSGLNQILSSRIAHMNSLVEDFNRERKVIDDKADSSLYKNLFYKFRDSGKSLIDDCKIIDRKGLTDFVLSQEKYAKSFHQLSWKLSKTGDTLGALESMNEAFQNLKSDALRLECVNDAVNIIKDAIVQSGHELTKKLKSTADKGSLEDLVGLKVEYLGKVNELFSQGKTFIDEQTQKTLGQMIAAELEIISKQAKEKYSANEVAENILQESLNWSSSGKNVPKASEARRVKRIWGPKDLVAKETQPRMSIVVLVAVMVVIASVIAIRNQINAPKKITQTSGVTTAAIFPADLESHEKLPEPQVVSSPALSGNMPPLIPPVSDQPQAQGPEPKPSPRENTIAQNIDTQGLAIQQKVAHAAASLGRIPELPTDHSRIPESELPQAAAQMKAQIEAHKDEIKALESDLDLRMRESEFRQSSIDRLNNKIGSNPDSPEYNFWVEEHNELVRQQNQALEEQKMIYKKYQEEFKAHQGMINSYNDKFAR